MVIVLGVLSWLVGMWVAYLVMKAAVRNGILEADAVRGRTRSSAISHLGAPLDLDTALARSRESVPEDE